MADFINFSAMQILAM